MNQEVLPLIDDFDVKPVYDERTYERHQFSLTVDGNKYKGDFHDGEIQWLHPHPKQYLEEDHLKSVEDEIHELIGEYGIKDETDDILVKPMFDNQTHEAHKFKLRIQGDEYTGVFRNGEVQWFHPKPRRKLKDERVKKVEEKAQEIIKEHMD